MRNTRLMCNIFEHEVDNEVIPSLVIDPFTFLVNLRAENIERIASTLPVNSTSDLSCHMMSLSRRLRLAF